MDAETHAAIEAMDEEAKQALYAVTRRFTGMTMVLYDDDHAQICSYDESATKHWLKGVQFEFPAETTKTIMAHVRIGPYEFWLHTVGRDCLESITKRFTFGLP